MKSDLRIKIMRILLAATFLLLMPLMIQALGCGGGSTSSNPPISIPAPTGGYINGTAPSSVDGKALVYGYIMVDGTPKPNVNVKITNTTAVAAIAPSLKATVAPKAITVTTITDANAYFSTSIAATVGDTINIQYEDPTYLEYSDPASFTVGNKIQPIPTSGMIPQDVDIDTDTGYAYVVANDGTDSQIIAVDLTTGSIVKTIDYPSATFDKIAVHSSSGYAAVLDTDASSNNLKWCDLSATGTGTCASYDPVGIPEDVAVIDLADSPATTGDFVVITYAYSNTSYAFASTYPITTSGSSYVLDNAHLYNICISNPDDRYYPTCLGSLTDPVPTGATLVTLTSTALNVPRMSIIAEYDDGSKVAYFFYFTLSSGQVQLNTTAGTYLYATLTTGVTPYALEWYNISNALIIDTANNQLLKLTDATTTITQESIAAGTAPRGLAPDSVNNRAFVADYSANTVLKVDMTTFQLSGTEYNVRYGPTDLVYYSDGTVQSVGAILTSPEPLFQTIDVAE